MNKRVTRSVRTALLALGIGAATSLALANGDDFFEAPHEGSVGLVYFGNIKDVMGHVLDGAVVTVTAKSIGLAMPFENSVIGHYRSPDIGAALKQLGEKIDPNQISIVCNVAGYRQAKPAMVPAKADGAVEVDFVMEKVVAAN
jgi:hypothetical protein